MPHLRVMSYQFPKVHVELNTEDMEVIEAYGGLYEPDHEYILQRSALMVWAILHKAKKTRFL